MQDQKDSLQELLLKYETVFQGGLGTLNIKLIHLELKPDAQPYHARPFKIPYAFEATTKWEIERLTEIIVMKKSSDSNFRLTFVICDCE